MYRILTKVKKKISTDCNSFVCDVHENCIVDGNLAKEEMQSYPASREISPLFGNGMYLGEKRALCGKEELTEIIVKIRCLAKHHHPLEGL